MSSKKVFQVAAKALQISTLLLAIGIVLSPLQGHTTPYDGGSAGEGSGRLNPSIAITDPY